MAGVSCYRNLNRKGVVWSVKSNRTGLVVGRGEYVMVKDAKLVVSKAGRNRVLNEKRKNVHAFVRGTWVRSQFDQHVQDWRGFTGVVDAKWVRISYNPYKNDSFVRQDTGAPITESSCVILDKDGAWAVVKE